MNRNRLLAAALAWAPLALAAQLTPTLVNYQGRLTDNSPQQNPLNATVAMQFAIYDAASAGTLLWQEPAGTATTAVLVVNGIFNVQLGGNGVALPASVFAGGTTRWLQITAGGEVLAPRQQIAAAGYAHQAQNAGNSAQLGGLAASQFVQTTDSRLSDARAPTAGSGFYIQNGTTAQAGASFNIAGNGTIGGGNLNFNNGTGNTITFANVGVAPPGPSGAGWRVRTWTPDFGIGIDAATQWYSANTNHRWYTVNSSLTTWTQQMNLDNTGTLSVAGPILSATRPVVTGSAPLRMARGQVSAAGGLVAGEGFTVSRITTGIYSVNFNPAFSGAPAVTASYVFTGTTATPAPLLFAKLWGTPGASGFFLTIHNASNVPTDSDFDFIAIGPP